VVLELKLLTGSREGRVGWFIRALVASAAIMSLGLLVPLDSGDLRHVYVSLPGMWLLVSTFMLDNTIRVKKSGLIEILLQTYGPPYLRLRYLMYIAAMFLLSILLVLLILLVDSLIIGIETIWIDFLALIVITSLGSSIFATTTVLLSVKIGGLRLLDVFSLVIGGLTFLLTFSTPFLTKILMRELLAYTLLIGAILVVALTAAYLDRHDFPALLTI